MLRDVCAETTGIRPTDCRGESDISSYARLIQSYADAPDSSACRPIIPASGFRPYLSRLDKSSSQQDNDASSSEIGAMLFTAQRTATAQCKVSIDSNEGKLLAFYTAPIIFSRRWPGGASTRNNKDWCGGGVHPKPDPAIEQTGACFTQKSEHTSLSPVFGRPRITIGWPIRIAVEAAYLPPVTIARATPNLASFAISNAHHLRLGPSRTGRP